MKKNSIFIILAILSGVATTPIYSMFQLAKPVRKPIKKLSWTHFDAFTRIHPYRLSKSGVETSSTWRRAAVRAARKDSSNIRLIARHIARFIEQKAMELLYNENKTIYKESARVAFKNAKDDAQDLAQHDELMILIDYDPTFKYETSSAETSSDYSESF